MSKQEVESLLGDVVGDGVIVLTPVNGRCVG